MYHTLRQVCPGGHVGVDIFFVLSGYLITTLLTEEFNRCGWVDIPAFYARRALRLVPALYLMLAAYGALALLRNDPKPYLLACLPALGFVMNLSRYFNWFGDGDLGHLWSLGVEAQFYLVWPFVLLAILRLDRRRAAWVIVCAIVAGMMLHAYFAITLPGFNRNYLLPDTRCEQLLIGALIALSPDMCRRSFARRWQIPAIGMLGIVLWTSPMTATTFYFPLVDLCAGWLVLAAVTAPPRVLASAPLVYLGRISYGVFVWHWTVYRYFYHQLAGLQLVSATAIVTLIAAMISFHFVELPLQRRGRRWLVERGH